MLGVGATALAAVPGDPLKLGRFNSIDRISTLAGNVSGPLLKVTNEGSGATLALQANAGNLPLRVNTEAGKATNLDADKLDGMDSFGFYAQGDKVADASHADQSDSATNADNANNLDGKD